MCYSYFKNHRNSICKQHKQVATQDEAGLGLWDPVPILSPLSASRMSSAGNSWKITELGSPAVIKKEPIRIHTQAKQVSPGPRTVLSPGHHKHETADTT